MLMQDELGSIARDLIADLERARPGFPLSRAGFEAAARERLQLRLADLRAQFASLGSDADFDRVRRELDDVLLRRYVTFALPQSERDRVGGPSVLERLAWAVGGLVLGGFLVWAPFVPIWEKWLPFALMLLGPFLPDWQRSWRLRQHGRRLLALESDLDEAGRALRASQPLTGLGPVEESTPPPRPGPQAQAQAQSQSPRQ
jgi:hypothetical protein